MSSTNSLFIAIDGASKGNPGPAGIGVLITDDQGAVIAEIARSIGIATNNVAEYKALIVGLQEAIALKARRVRVQTDSELLARQVQGRYKISAPHLRALYTEVIALKSQFEHFEIGHTLRAGNTRADGLANRGVLSAEKNPKS